jgi:hypothetical protein
VVGDERVDAAGTNSQYYVCSISRIEAAAGRALYLYIY